MSTSLACIALLRAGLKTRSKGRDKNKNFQLKFEVSSFYDWLLNKYQHVPLDSASEWNSLQLNSCFLMAFNILTCQNMLTLMMAIIILKDVIKLFIYLLPWYFSSIKWRITSKQHFCFSKSKLVISKYLLEESVLLCWNRRYINYSEQQTRSKLRFSACANGWQNISPKVQRLYGHSTEKCLGRG